ncbi:MAG: serine hydrolase domain-containing protein, partial [Myxococcota bacterium]
MKILTLSVFLYATTAAAQEAPGGFAAAVTDGQKTTERVLRGVADPESDTAVTQETVFHVASLSKQITAAALAMAIVEGKLALDDPLSKHIPEAKHYGKTPTLAHLMYFTSGLTEAYDLPRKGGVPWVTQYHFTVDDAIAASLSVRKLQFTPGSQWRYNNINFQLLAEVVERAYRKPFSAVVREKIFTPLGMTRSLIHDDITAVVPGHAPGVLARSPEAVEQLRSVGIHAASTGGPILIRRNAPHYGGSGVLTTIDDWMRWERAMLGRKVFPARFWTLMFSTRKFAHSKSNDAFGLVHGSYQGTPMVWFAGGDIDASSYMLASSEAGIASARQSKPGVLEKHAE